MTERILQTVRLEQMEPYMSKIHVGEIFFMKLRTGGFLFGRIVSKSAKYSPDITRGVNLIYIYKHVFPSVENIKWDWQWLTVHNLLVPPIMIDDSAWRMGYFDSLASFPMSATDILPQHCFLDRDSGRVYDEFAKEVSKQVDPVGEMKCFDIQAIDKAVNAGLEKLEQ